MAVQCLFENPGENVAKRLRKLLGGKGSSRSPCIRMEGIQMHDHFRISETRGKLMVIEL